MRHKPPLCHCKLAQDQNLYSIQYTLTLCTAGPEEMRGSNMASNPPPSKKTPKNKIPNNLRSEKVRSNYSWLKFLQETNETVFIISSQPSKISQIKITRIIITSNKQRVFCKIKCLFYLTHFKGWGRN